MRKNKFQRLRDEREAKERKDKLPMWASLVMVIVAFGGCVTMLAVGDLDKSEQAQCDKYCMSEYGLKGVLVPIITNQRTRPDASKGPYKCTCPRN
jgi:hypothetical protein